MIKFNHKLKLMHKNEWHFTAIFYDRQLLPKIITDKHIFIDANIKKVYILVNYGIVVCKYQI